jgi:hypothetical protein
MLITNVAGTTTVAVEVNQKQRMARPRRPFHALPKPFRLWEDVVLGDESYHCS